MTLYMERWWIQRREGLLTPDPKTHGGQRDPALMHLWKPNQMSTNGKKSAVKSKSEVVSLCVVYVRAVILCLDVKFKSLATAKRQEFARDKRLCFNCLLTGHFAGSCKLNRRCSVLGCGEWHTKFLHKVEQVREGNVTSEETDEKPSTTCTVTGAGKMAER